MKLKLVALTLIAFVCWLVPLKTLAQETYKPKQKVEINIKPPEDYVSDDIVIKNNAIQPTLSKIEPTGKPTIHSDSSSRRDYSGRTYTKEEVQQLIRDYSVQYGINPDVPLCIARLESGFNQFSKNKTSSASGVFQYLSSTWVGTDEYKHGLSVFDADANVRAAIKYMASRKSTSPWVVGPRCPSLNKFT